MEVAASKQTSDRRPAQDLYGDVFPESWYAVMESDALRRGKALPVDALGKPLVLFRTASGAVTAMDRYCPHMGASLACGRVEGSGFVALSTPGSTTSKACAGGSPI